MLKKAASLAAAYAVAFLMPMFGLRAGTVSTVTALPAAPAASKGVDLDTKPVAVTAVPEPTTLVLVAGALTWCLLRGRRRSQAPASAPRQIPL